MFLCLGVTNAQTTTTELVVRYYKHMVGVNFSNDITAQVENYKQNEVYSGEDMSYSYDPQYGYSAALLYQYRATDWFSVETGLGYNSTKHYQNFVHADISKCENLYFSCLQDLKLKRERLAVPLNLRWYYQKDKWAIYALTGIVLGFDTRSTEGYELTGWNDPKQVIGSYRADSIFGLGISAGLGFEYLLGKNFVLRAEPRFRLYDLVRPYRPTFSSYARESEYREMHYAIGLNVGIYYGFKGQ